MKNNIVVGVIVVAIIAVAIPFMVKLRTSSGSPSESPPANPSNTLTTEDTVKTTGVEVVNLLVNADTAGLSARFAPNMKTEMPPAQIIQGWNAVIAQAGTFKQQLGVRVERRQGNDVAVVTCQFERGKVDVQVTVNQGLVVNLYAAPVRP